MVLNASSGCSADRMRERSSLKPTSRSCEFDQLDRRDHLEKELTDTVTNSGSPHMHMPPQTTVTLTTKRFWFTRLTDSSLKDTRNYLPPPGRDGAISRSGKCRSLSSDASLAPYIKPRFRVFSLSPLSPVPQLLSLLLRQMMRAESCRSLAESRVPTATRG